MLKNTAGQEVHFSLFKSAERIDNPTLAEGDFRVSLDGGAQANVTTLPTSDAAGLVTWLPTQAETNADYVVLLGKDAAGDEWEPITIVFETQMPTSVEAILADTAEIGAAGAGLTAVPWNTAWDAEVQSEAADALAAYDPPTDTEMDAALLALQGADGDTLKTLSDQLDSVEPADVWSYSVRTLTSVASGTGVTDASGEAEIRTHDYFSKSISGLGDLSSRIGSGMVFTVKRSYSDADSAAILQVSEVGGLTVLNSATYTTTTDGSITVTDENTGALTVVLLTGATSKLTIERGLLYDIKQIKADGTSQVMERGTCNILGTATRKVA